MIDFVHCHVHSSIGSMVDSMIPVDKLFKRASELKMSSIALTDHGSMAGMFDAHKAAKKYGIKFIPGCEIYFVYDIENMKEKRKHLVLLAKNEKGYKNLLRLNYEGFQNKVYVPVMNKVFPRVDWKLLEKHSEGLICLSACSSGPLAKTLLERDENNIWNKEEQFEKAKEMATRLCNIFGKDFYLEIQPHNLQVYKTNRKTGSIEVDESGMPILTVDQKYLNQSLIKMSKELKIKTTATCDVHYLDKSDAGIHDMLMAISSKAPLSDKNRHRYGVSDFYLKTGQEVFDFFEEYFGRRVAKLACKNTLEISNKCEPSDYLETKEIRFPKFPILDEEDYDEFKDWLAKQKTKKLPEDHAFMRFRCVKAFKNKFSKLPKKERKEYLARMKKEVKVLEQHNFSSYMLIVADYIEKARKRGISIGPGRGCLTNDALVLTENGYRNLDQVKIGDKVFTHTGQLKEVEKRFEYNIDEELLSIKTDFSFGNINLTKDHRIFAQRLEETEKYKRAKKINPKWLGKIKRWSKVEKCEPEWIEAQKLNIGDLIFMPFPKRKIGEFAHLDLSKFIINTNKYTITDNEIIRKIPLKNEFSLRFISKQSGLSRGALQNIKNQTGLSKGRSINKLKEYLKKFNMDLEEWVNMENVKVERYRRFVPFDESFCYFLGRWVGDGWLRNGKFGQYHIGLAFNSDDKIGINKIKDFFNNIGFSCYFNHSKTKKLSQLCVYGDIFVNVLRHYIEGYKNKSNTKHLPRQFRDMNNLLLSSLMSGYFDSDGSNKDKYNRSVYDTTSLRLALETKEALLYLGLESSIRERSPYCRGKYMCQKSYKISFNMDRKMNRFDNGYFVKILDISKIYANKVYDIQVEDDHSYLTQNYAVHNSVCGSLVGYLLDIHGVNPMEYGLIFERFHNKEKKSFPDIDTDIHPDGRAWIKEYITNKYGKEKVAHVSNLSRLTPKVVIKDIARSLELGGTKSKAFQIANKITETIPISANTFEEAYQDSKEFRAFCEQFPDLVKYGPKLCGLERAYATHAAGIVISDIDLSTFVPLRVDKDGAVSVQYEKERCESLGLIKMDLLGLESLKIIENTIRNIKKMGESPKEELWPYDDKNVWKDVSDGKTLCVFQMGSPHMRALCKRIKPQSIEELGLVNTLGRPSLKKFRNDYIARRNKLKEIEYKYPCIKPAVKDTLGICVYEDQLMRLANVVAGWDLNEADNLRRITKMKGKHPELTQKTKEKFIKDAAAHSKINEKEAEGIWVDIIAAFEGYGFNLSHASAYSINGYYTAYYAHYYPAEFMAAVLKSEAGKNSSPDRDANLIEYKAETKKMGIQIKVPDINISDYSYSVADKKSIITGFDVIKGVGQKAIQNIIEVRNQHPFKSFADFLYRTKSSLVRKTIIQSLAKAGCFDSLGISRKIAHDYYDVIRTKANKYAKKNNTQEAWDRLNDFEYEIDEAEWDIKDRLRGEQEVLGEFLSGTIHDLYGGFFTTAGTTFDKIQSMPKNFGVRIEAIVMGIKSRKLKNGKNAGRSFAECSLSDKNNSRISLTIWPEQWVKYKPVLGIGKAVRAVAKVNVYNGAHGLVLERIEKLNG